MKKELVDSLIDTDHSRNAGQIALTKMTARELRKIASNLGMATTKTVTQRFIPGWAGKGKGLLQVKHLSIRRWSLMMLAFP